MKNLFLLLAVAVLPAYLSAQSYEPEDLVKFKQDTIGHYYVSKLKSNQVYIPMDFNSADIKDLSAYREIKDNSILKVELIYTAYQKSELFNQPKLNIDRLKNLQEQAPELFASSLTKWKFIAQTDCANEEEARLLFHGFVISYRPEMAMPISADISKGFHDKVNQYIKLVADVADKKPGAQQRLQDNFPELRDTTVLAVMNRKPGWKELPIVCDVTGSMSPYMLQTMIWFKLHSKAASKSSYTFFNDGDMTPDERKVIGATGGIYYKRTEVYDTVETYLLKAMQSGSGGDAPENNIEALIRTQEKLPDCKEIVMIADNYANVKDISLLEKVNRPVHIILCGAQTGINADYLNIARATGGSVHTIERDIEDLAKLEEGEIFIIKGQKFRLEKGRFKLVFES